MKVLIVSNMFPDAKHPSSGIFVKKFCDEISKIGIEYDLGIMHWYDTKKEKILGYMSFYLGTFLKLITHKYDIIYIHYASHSSIPVLWASKFKQMLIYTNVHGSDVVPENRTHEKFQKYTGQVLKLSKKVIVPSQYFQDYVSEKYSIDEKMINIYPSSGVDTEYFEKLSKERVMELKKQYDVGNGKAIFCYVGRITANKGWDTFLRAVSILKIKGTTANYVFVGDGLEKSQYNSLVKELGLEKEIKKYSLLSQRELVSIYNISDAFVFPTRREGESLGLVAIEAMACGTPVISCDFAAPKYYVQDDYNGYKFPVGDAEQLANIMEGFVSGKYTKENLTRGCIETAQKYDSRGILKKLREIFGV